MVFFVLRALGAEDVLPVIDGEGAAILPLGVADFFRRRGVDLEPATLADAGAGFGDGAGPPGDDACGFWAVSRVINAVVVGEGDVKGILAGGDAFWKIADAGLGVGVIVSAEVFLPVLIPR